MEILNLGYIEFEVSDMAAWRSFATDGLLGMEARDAQDSDVLLRLDEYSQRIRLRSGPADDVSHLGWEVANERDLEAVAARLAAAGVEVTEGAPAELERRELRRLIRFRDPAGVSSDVHFGATLVRDRPFRPTRPIGPFVTGDMGIGHAVLAVEDVDACVAFYRDVLGFRVTDYITFGGLGTVVFMRCGRRHHSVAFAQTLPFLKRKLIHTMVELERLDDVGAAYYHCINAGIGLEHNLGRHVNDDMLSFYAITPSDFSIEYAWGGLTIEDDAAWRVRHHLLGSTWGHDFLRQIPMPG